MFFDHIHPPTHDPISYCCKNFVAGSNKFLWHTKYWPACLYIDIKAWLPRHLCQHVPSYHKKSSRNSGEVLETRRPWEAFFGQESCRCELKAILAISNVTGLMLSQLDKLEEGLPTSSLPSGRNHVSSEESERNEKYSWPTGTPQASTSNKDLYRK